MEVNVLSCNNVLFLIQVSIDNKTERAAMLEQELKATEDRLLQKEEALAEARKKLR
jgi:predicted ATP-grasp superfamily ATP-dependent carboligase